MAQVANAIVDNTLTLCEECGLTTNHIADGAFQCFTQNAHEVTFRAHLYATSTSTPRELIDYITHWVESGASITISGLLLSVDGRCNVEIESFSESECSHDQTTQPATTIETTTTKEPTVPLTTAVDHTTILTTTPIHKTTASEQPIATSVEEEDMTSSLHFSAEVIIIGSVVVMVIFIIACMLTIIIVVCLCTKYCR